MIPERERNERGQFVETIRPSDVLRVLEESPAPFVTAKEVGEQLDCTAEAARQKLIHLQDRGIVTRRKVGAGAVVWWRTDREPAPAHPEAIDPADPLFATPATFASGHADSSQNVEAILANAIEADRDDE